MKFFCKRTQLMMGSKYIQRAGTTVLLAFAISGCGGGSGADAPETDQLRGIVVNDVRAQQGRLGCLIVVTATNTTDTLKGVNLNYQAFSASGQYVGFAITQQFFIGANTTLTTRTDLTGNYIVGLDGATPLPNCNSVATFRLDIAGTTIAP